MNNVIGVDDYKNSPIQKSIELSYFSEVNEIEKAEFSDKVRKKLSSEGEAEKDGSYPIRNESDLKNAVQAYGRSKDKAKTKAWIKKRAKDLGCEGCLPEDWKEKEISKGTDCDYGSMLEKAKANDEQQKKVKKVMDEWKSGKLKSSSGDKVTDQKQAIAIAMSEAGLSKALEEVEPNEKEKDGSDKYDHLKDTQFGTAGKIKDKIQKAIDQNFEKGLIDPLTYLKASVQLDNIIEKAGEGSRGGRVIGHTRSGKAIYLHEADTNSTSAGGIHAGKFKDWTKEDHYEGIYAHNESKNRINEKWKREYQEHLASGKKERYNPSNEENKDRVNHLQNIDAHHYQLAVKHGMSGKNTLQEAYDHEGKNRIYHGDSVEVKNTGAKGTAHYAENGHHYVKFKDGSDGYFKEHELKKSY